MPDNHGRLKIFLSFAEGVGKTYAMLDEAQRRKNRGQDVVVGLVDAKSRPATVELVDTFEKLPHAPRPQRRSYDRRAGYRRRSRSKT